MTRAQILHAMHEQASRDQILQRQYDATLQAFQDAHLRGAVDEGEQRRRDLHTLLDQMLDSFAVVLLLQRQLSTVRDEDGYH